MDRQVASPPAVASRASRLGGNGAAAQPLPPSPGGLAHRPRLGPAERLLASRFYPGALQAPMAVVFLLVLVYSFAGPPLGENNLAVVVTWKLWWLLLPFSFLFFGRLWCAVCPVGAVSDVAQKVPVPRRAVPGALLRRGGPWVMGSLFVAFFVAGMVAHICCWPVPTAIVLLMFIAGAGATGLAYRGRAWCRYLCPLGSFSGLYSMLGVVGLRSARPVCQGECRHDKRRVLRAEMAACPWYELPMAMETNRNCNICGACAKYCQYGSMRLRPLAPGSDLWRVRRPLAGEAVFAAALVGIAFVEAIQTTRLFPAYMKWALERGPLGSYNLVFTLSILAAVAVAVGAYLAAAWLSGRMGGRGGRAAASSFAYGLLPLALASYLAVAAFRLAAEVVRALQVTVNQVSFGIEPFLIPPPVRGSFYQVDTPIKALQFAILAAGTALALYALWRIGGRSRLVGRRTAALPHAALVVAFAAVFAVTFTLPAGMILH